LLIQGSTAPAGGQYGKQALGDPDPWIQHQAVLMLSRRLNEPETVSLLADFFARSDEMVNEYAQGAAGLRLLKAGHADIVRPHAKRYTTLMGQPWRAAPLALVAAKMGDMDALKTLKTILEAAELPLEIEFLIDMGQSGITDLVASLEIGQDLVEEELMLSFALARMALKDVGGEHVLRLALQNEEEDVRLEALDLLTRLPGTEHLLQRAASRRPGPTKWYGELALIGRGERPSEGLAKAVVHEDRMVREYAARFAGEVSSSSHKKPNRVIRQVVKKAMTDEDSMVRVVAIRSAVKQGAQSLKPELQARLGDEVLAVRIEAAGALLSLLPSSAN
jgi:HEAT repeat protein